MTTTDTTAPEMTAPEMTDTRPLFTRSLALASHTIGAVRADQLDRPTPCHEMTVELLVAHLVSVVDRLAVVGAGGDPFGVPDYAEGDGPDRWRVVFDASVAKAQVVWSDDAVLARMLKLPWAELPGFIALPIYINELSVHTWDLATATDQSPEWDDEVLAAGYDAIQIGLPAEGRVESFDAVRDSMPEGYQNFTPPFAAAVTVSDDAPLIEKLVGCNGRQP